MSFAYEQKNRERALYEKYTPATGSESIADYGVGVRDIDSEIFCGGLDIYFKDNLD